MHHTPITCAEFESRLQDYLESDLDSATHAQLDAHRAACPDCNALAAELNEITTKAGKLPVLSADRDLWDGIASRIEAEVVEFPVTPLPGEVRAVVPANGGPVHAEYIPAADRPSSHVLPRPAVSRFFQLAAAASVLVAVTAGVTWNVASRGSPAGENAAADSGFATAMASTRSVSNVAGPTLDVTYDTEIASLRKLVDEQRAEIDSTTLAVLERNLKVIDDAIAESKAALAGSPTSSFLMERLADAYDTKLRTLRAVVTAAPRG